MLLLLYVLLVTTFMSCTSLAGVLLLLLLLAVSMVETMELGETSLSVTIFQIPSFQKEDVGMVKNYIITNLDGK